MKLKRRQVLTGIGGFYLGYRPSISFAKTSLKIGDAEIFSVSDGHLVLPKDMFFGDLPKEPVEKILSEYGISSDQLHPPCNLTLLRQADKTVLFDAGSGTGFMPSAGILPDSLDALGVTPEEITHVVFTHAHPDHLWGVLDDFDDPVFTDAELLIGQTEWDYWTDPNTVNTIGNNRASFAVGAARRLDAVKDQVKFIKDGQEIISGVVAHSTPGHTPGHMSFEIRNGTNAVMVGGDAIGNHHVAFERPDWISGADQDGALGAKTRQRLLDQLVADDIMLMGFHLPDGGLGRVERKGGNFHFNAKDK